MKKNRYTKEDFDELIITNAEFRKAWNELNVFFNGVTVSQKLSDEIEEYLKTIIKDEQK